MGFPAVLAQFVLRTMTLVFGHVLLIMEIGIIAANQVINVDILMASTIHGAMSEVLIENSGVPAVTLTHLMPIQEEKLIGPSLTFIGKDLQTSL